MRVDGLKRGALERPAGAGFVSKQLEHGENCGVGLGFVYQESVISY